MSKNSFHFFLNCASCALTRNPFFYPLFLLFVSFINLIHLTLRSSLALCGSRKTVTYVIASVWMLLCDCVCVSLSLSMCASVCVSVSVCVFFSPCIAVSIPLSACQHAYIYDMHIYSGVQRLENDRDQLLWNPNLGASIRPLVINTIFCYFIPHLHKEIRWMLEVIAPFADSISQHHSIFVRMSVCLRA